MWVEKNNKNPWTFDKKVFLEELSVDIANKFWIKKEQTKELIKKETLMWIDSLKTELGKEKNDTKKLNEKDIEDLFFTLKWALEVTENSSKIEIKILKDSLETNINIEDFKNNIEKYLPPKLVYKAKNPKLLHEHILGFALGTTNSIFATVEILYQIWKWILQTPYHLYMIITWKWKTNSFKEI